MSHSVRYLLVPAFALAFAACGDDPSSKGGCADSQVCGDDCCAANEICVADMCQPKAECTPACEGGKVCENGICEMVGCEISSQLGTFAKTGEYQWARGSALLVVELPAVGDVLWIEMYDGYGVFAEGFRTGTFQLSGDDLDYQTCGLCVLLVAFDSNDEPVANYMPTGGTVEINDIGAYSFSAVLTNVTFQQVEFSEALATTPAGTGCESSIASATVSGTAPPSCDPLDPSSCASGEGCYFVMGSGYGCFPAGTSPVKWVCNGTNRCVPGADCWGYDNPENRGVCLQYCSISNPTHCAAGSICKDIGEGDLGACFPTPCDPLDPNACAPGQGCYAAGADFECMPAGTLEVGERCDRYGQCVHGAECFLPGLCLAFCDVTGTVECPDNYTCFGLEGYGIDNLGVCTAPVCDPLAPDACPDGESCYLGSAGFECMAVGTSDLGAECNYGFECMAGMDCVDAMWEHYSGECALLCGNAADCPVLSTCEEFREGVGYCSFCSPSRTCGTVCCAMEEVCDESGEAPACVLPSPPANDNCAGAIALTLGETVQGTTRGAADDFGYQLNAVCHAAVNYNNAWGPDVVYSYTPTASGGFTVTVMPEESKFDAFIWVTAGVCGDYEACIDAADAVQRGAESVTVGATTPDTTYYIVVDTSLGVGDPSSASAFTISIVPSEQTIAL